MRVCSRVAQALVQACMSCPLRLGTAHVLRIALKVVHFRIWFDRCTWRWIHSDACLVRAIQSQVDMFDPKVLHYMRLAIRLPCSCG